MADASDAHEELTSPDPQFEPIIKLPEVEIKTLEEDEDELLRLRAKLFRFDSEADPQEWKERGTGDIKFLKHKEKGHIRVLMRRDKTLKVCANHFVLPNMSLTPKSGNPKAWVWSTPADYTDNEAKAEMLAIRFGSVENAQKFKTAFDDAREKMGGVLGECKDGEKDDTKEKSGEKNSTEEKKCAETNGTAEKEEDSVTEKLGELTVKDKSETTPAKGGTGDGSEVKSDPSSPTEKSPTKV